MAEVKYWCSGQNIADRIVQAGHHPAVQRCRKEECAKWDSDLNCPALSLTVRMGGRSEVCYSNK
jgi:hypothetical protein